MKKWRDPWQSKVTSFLINYRSKKKEKLMNKRPERTWDCKVRAFYKDKNNSTKGLDMKTRRDQMNEQYGQMMVKMKMVCLFLGTCAITGKKVSWC